MTEQFSLAVFVPPNNKEALAHFHSSHRFLHPQDYVSFPENGGRTYTFAHQRIYEIFLTALIHELHSFCDVRIIDAHGAEVLHRTETAE